jgi:outer membrane protein assembly factor BamE (lipoprotein component of BamABCDE complex)
MKNSTFATCIALLVAAALSACSTPEDLKRSNPPVSFQVNANYQLVLKRFVDNYQ